MKSNCFFIMFRWYVSGVSVLRPSGRVIDVRIPTWIVGGCEPQASFMLRLRLPGLVQSGPFLLSSAPCFCMSCCLLCSSSCALPLFCPCFLSCFPSLASPGLQPSFSAGPRWCFLLLVLSCPCLSLFLSCLLSRLCAAAFQSCIHLVSCSSCFCLSELVALTPSDASSVPLGWCGVGRCVGDHDDFRLVVVACRKLIHAILEVFVARKFFSCGSGGVRPGVPRNPECLSL